MPVNLQVGVKILLKNAESKYLILHRSLKKYPESAKNGEWDIPGGRITPGTNLLANLKREVKEETNLDLIGEPKIIYAQDIIIPEFPDRHVVRLTYLGEASGEFKLDLEEHDDFKWLIYEEITKMPGVSPYLKAAL